MVNPFSIYYSEIRKLKECFMSLDDDGTGSIGLDEIKRPLIGLGLVETVEEVQQLIKLVDEDDSGEIEFNEFMSIISAKDGDNESPITEFFKNLVNDKYETNDMAFNNWVLREQRKHLLDAITADSDEKKEKGQRILQAIKAMEQEDSEF